MSQVLINWESYTKHLLLSSLTRVSNMRHLVLKLIRRYLAMILLKMPNDISHWHQKSPFHVAMFLESIALQESCCRDSNGDSLLTLFSWCTSTAEGQGSVRIIKCFHMSLSVKWPEWEVETMLPCSSTSACQLFPLPFQLLWRQDTLSYQNVGARKHQCHRRWSTKVST